MNTPPRPNISLSAQYLGPVFSLDAELSRRAQNLIFARNGIGKSFLSRALRYLDMHKQGNDISNAARDLISDESPDGKGQFTLSRGVSVLGSLELERGTDQPSAQSSDTILHVFSEDFVQEQLRARSYEIDGEIENQIAVDSQSIKLKEAKEALAAAEEKFSLESRELGKKFENEKVAELHTRAQVSKQLREFRSLNLESDVLISEEKPEPSEESLAASLLGLDSLRGLPSDPVLPRDLSPFSTGEIDLLEISACLEKITSPSSVSEEIKRKIESHHDFYQTGTHILQDEEQTTCPFCEQDISSLDPASIIDSYIKYFGDEEAQLSASELPYIPREIEDQG